MGDLPTRGDLKVLLKQGYQVIDYLRSMKRLYQIVVSKTAEQWVLTEYPPGYYINNNKLYDPDGNEVADVSNLITEWSYIASAIVGWRMVAAVLENEESFRDQNNQSVLKLHHRLFIDPFLPWEKRGEI